jgi:hypothetical protein
MRISAIDFNECIQAGINQARRIMDLEAENAALWAFVKEMRTLQVVLSDTKKPNETWKQRHTRKFHQAEELIYQYEDEP